MQTVTEFIEGVGRERFTAETGFAPQVISRAIVDNIMPAGWYLAVRSICERDKIGVPEHLFRWADKRKSPVHASSSEATNAR